MFLDQKTKNRLRVEAQFRPNLHTIAMPSLDYVAETTDAETVVKKIELTRNQDLLPLEKIQKCMESEFQCCHVERRTRGYGVNRKTYTIQCKNKAMAGNLRCPMHIGTPITDPKNVINLLLSQEDLTQSKRYPLLAGTAIFIPFKKEKSHQRHQMTMDILDHAFQRDLVTFKHEVIFSAFSQLVEGIISHFLLLTPGNASLITTGRPQITRLVIFKLIYHIHQNFKSIL